MIDHHVHFGRDDKFRFSLDEKTLLARLDKYSISKAVTFACPFPIANSSEPFEEANAEVLNLSKGDSRVVPFMFLHPFKNSLSYVQENHQNFAGFKFRDKCSPEPYSYAHLENSEVIQYLSTLNKPIIFHTREKETCRAKDLAFLAKSSSAPVVMAHCAGFLKEDLDLLSQYPKVYMDVSPMSIMLAKGLLANENLRDESLKVMNVEVALNYLEKLFGKDRIVWGTDTPWSDNLSENGYEKEIAISSVLSSLGLTGTFLK